MRLVLREEAPPMPAQEPPAQEARVLVTKAAPKAVSIPLLESKCDSNSFHI